MGLTRLRGLGPACVSILHAPSTLPPPGLFFPPPPSLFPKLRVEIAAIRDSPCQIAVFGP
ncbi:hypothetical protein DW210_01935 [Bifidobacterium bifidum]|nr:hypothetical protein DW210_01935 [Bifidobacterium bifidum]